MRQLICPQALPGSLQECDGAGWLRVYKALQISGVTRAVASHCTVAGVTHDGLSLQLDPAHDTLYNESVRERIELALQELFGRELKLVITPQGIRQETPAMYAQRQKALRLQAAIDSVRNDPNVKRLVTVLGAEIAEASVVPAGTGVKGEAHGRKE